MSLNQALFTRGKHVLINPGELHYWQFLNPIGEEIFQENLPATLLIHLLLTKSNIWITQQKAFKNKYEREHFPLILYGILSNYF